MPSGRTSRASFAPGFSPSPSQRVSSSLYSLAFYSRCLVHLHSLIFLFGQLTLFSTSCVAFLDRSDQQEVPLFLSSTSSSLSITSILSIPSLFHTVEDAAPATTPNLSIGRMRHFAHPPQTVESKGKSNKLKTKPTVQQNRNSAESWNVTGEKVDMVVDLTPPLPFSINSSSALSTPFLSRSSASYGHSSAVSSGAVSSGAVSSGAVPSGAVSFPPADLPASPYPDRELASSFAKWRRSSREASRDAYDSSGTSDRSSVSSDYLPSVIEAAAMTSENGGVSSKSQFDYFSSYLNAPASNSVEEAEMASPYSYPFSSVSRLNNGDDDILLSAGLPWLTVKTTPRPQVIEAFNLHKDNREQRQVNHDFMARGVPQLEDTRRSARSNQQRSFTFYDALNYGSSRTNDDFYQAYMHQGYGGHPYS